MRQYFWRDLFLFSTLLLSFSVSEAFLDSARHLGRNVEFADESLHSFLFPRDVPGDDEEDTTGSGLPSCLPRCGTINSAPGQKTTKRAKFLTSRSGACGLGESGGCMQRRENTTDLSGRAIERRTLPTGNDDLRLKTREQLGAWITQRIQYDNDVKLIWDSDDVKQYIQLTLLDNRQAVYPIPTAFFANPGNEAFAWGTIGLVGCSLMTAVRVPQSADDKAAGVYMGHYWEVPGWDTDEEQQADDEGNLHDVKIMNAQSGAYIYDFLRKGFPHTPMRRRTPANLQDPTYANPTQQDSLTQHVSDLAGGFAKIMHPQKTVENPPDSGHYDLGDGPQFPTTLTKMREVMEKIFTDKNSNLQIGQDYLYRPDREHTRYANTQSGRSLFEYQPNFNGRKTGMLLYEDGGEQGPKNPDGTYQPGPGGPFFFDFGPAEDTQMGGT